MLRFLSFVPLGVLKTRRFEVQLVFIDKFVKFKKNMLNFSSQLTEPYFLRFLSGVRSGPGGRRSRLLPGEARRRTCGSLRVLTHAHGVSGSNMKQLGCDYVGVSAVFVLIPEERSRGLLTFTAELRQAHVSHVTRRIQIEAKSEAPQKYVLKTFTYLKCVVMTSEDNEPLTC